jgi:serine/threonine protein kinase
MERYCYRCEKNVELRTDPQNNAQLCAVCGAVIVHRTNDLPPGTVLGGFRIVDELGRGGMGIVYRARQLNLERDVALKVLADNLSDDREFVERFFKEARAAASLNHPNIVQVFDAGRSPEGISFFAMELIEGETLEMHIAKNGKLSPKEALKVAVKIAEALDYAWKSQKLTHGDIKPDNIILNKSGGAKLADLGLAKCVHDETNDDSIMVTPLYAPPEVIRGDTASIGFHSDMYSFGATLYQMLAGLPPFPDNSPEIVCRQHLYDTPPSLYTFNERLAPSLVHICEQMMKKNPDKRPESWASVYKTLKKIHEPELSKKVFHTHNQSDSGDDKRESSSLKRMVKNLTALILLLVIAIGAVFVLKNKSKESIKKEAIIADPEVVIKKWNELKKEIASLKTEEALGSVRKFIDEFSHNVPPDALEILKQLEKKSEVLEQIREKQLKDQSLFESDIAKTLQLLKGVNLDSDKSAISELSSINKRIQSLLWRVSDLSYLKFPDKSEKLLKDASAKLSARISEYRISMEKIRNEKIAKLQEARLKKIKEEISQMKTEMDMQRTLNSTIDNYYTALADFKDLKKVSVLQSDLLKCDEDSDVIAPQYAVRVEFLTKVIIPNASSIYRLIKSKESFFQGQGLPAVLAPGKLKYYKVKEFSDKGIKLIYNNDKVTLGHTVPWGTVSHKNLLLLAESRLLNSDDALTDDEKGVFASFALLFYPEKFPEFYGAISTLSDRDKQCWKLIKKDFEITGDELECIKLYRTLLDALYREEYSAAADIFYELKRVSKNTLFESRYAKVLPDVDAEIKKRTPKLSALQQIQNLLESSIDPVKQFNTAMVIDSRYCNILSDIDGLIIKRFKDCREAALSELTKRSGVKKLSDNRIPFFYWAKEKQGASKAYSDIVEKSRKLQRFPDAMQAMILATALDDGNWEEVNSIYNSTKRRGLEFLHKAPSAIRPWLPAFLFAYGLADLQVGDGASVSAIRESMEKLYSINDKGAISPLVSSLVFEYDLLTRQRSFPLGAARKYNYKKFASFPMTPKVAMLGILALLDEPSWNSGKFNFLQKTLSNLYRKNAKMRGDLYFINAANQLFNGKNLSQSQIQQLRSFKCSYPDTASRILVAALSRYHAEGGDDFEDEEVLIQTIEDNVTPLIISGDLWRRITIFKMAHKAYVDDVKRVTVKALEETKISTTRFYPALLMINAGGEFILGNYNKSDLKKYLTEYFRASSLVSDSDISDLKIITEANPSRRIEKLFKEDQPEKAFRYGIFGIMVHCKDFAAKSKIVKIMERYDKVLCWEERYLMKQIQNWR